MRYFRPLVASVPAFCAFALWMWLATLVTNYDGTLRLSSYETGPWFFLGLPFTCAAGLAFAAFVAFAVRRRHWATAALTLGVLLAVSIADGYGKLPGVRVSRILGCASASMVVHRLCEVPTFGDGTRWYGAISGPADTLNLILRSNPMLRLHEDVSLTGLQVFFPQDQLPDTGAAHLGANVTLYQDNASGRIYFERIPRQKN